MVAGMKRLEVLGWWFNEQAPTELPRPQLLVDAAVRAHREPLLAWLRAGVPLLRYPEPSFCRFACGATDMGHADLTDGRFVWPEGLAHYVDHHDVRLPEHIVAHALAQPLPLPPFPLPKAKFGLYDAGPWVAWGKAQRACPDLHGFEIPTLDVLDRIAADLGPVPHEAILACRGSSREVILAVAGGGIELHQLKTGGNPPKHFAGWHEWPLCGDGPQRSSAPTLSRKPKPGVPMGEFFANLKQQRDRQQ